MAPHGHKRILRAYHAVTRWEMASADTPALPMPRCRRARILLKPTGGRRSADEVGRHAFLRHREPVFLAPEGNAPHEKDHVFCECPHHLEPLEILRRFARLFAVDAVPVLSGGNRMPEMVKYLFSSSKVDVRPPS